MSMLCYGIKDLVTWTVDMVAAACWPTTRMLPQKKLGPPAAYTEYDWSSGHQDRRDYGGIGSLPRLCTFPQLAMPAFDRERARPVERRSK